MSYRTLTIPLFLLLGTWLGIALLASAPPTGIQAQDTIVILDQPAAASTKPQLDAIHVLDSHAESLDGTGQTIAILDAFVDPSVLDASRIVSVVDVLDEPSSEDSGHGTAVAAIAMDVAPGAEVLLYRVIDDNGTVDLDAATDAIVLATDAGATVINLSFTTTENYPELHAAIQAAHADGIHIVAAAGSDTNGSLPFPAAYSEVVAVSSVVLTATDDFELSDNAYQSGSVDLLAQGVDVVVPCAISPSGLALASGTSFAAPFVAGGVAILRSTQPGLTPMEVVQHLIDTAQDADLTPAQQDANVCDRVLDLAPVLVQ